MEYKYLNKINSPKDIKQMSLEELKVLSYEIREEIKTVVSTNGGHLASNLGTIELTLALHYVFNSPKDKLIWDVGHQTYAHKLITGRKEKFSTLRQYNGISGFPKRCESVHDIFEVGHSSTSLSAALGYDIANRLMKIDNKVICIMGDGAMTAGMAYEALNHMSELKSNVIFILNDNSMSINQNIGGLSKHLDRLRTAKTYNKFKNSLKKIFKKDIDENSCFYNFLVKIRDFIKFLFIGSVFFEELGIKYFGPVDGHDIDLLIKEFDSIKNLNRPVVIHVVTKKGKGYKYAEKKPEIYHGVGKFDLEKGIEIKKKDDYSSVLGETLVELGEKDKRIVTITAAMLQGTGLDEFAKKFPNRLFDVGIAEQHGVTFAAGLASAGMRPIFAVYSTFLQRGYDQIVHDVCLQKLPVIFAIDRAGLVGADGETHHGVFDIAFLRHIPNMTIMSPKNKNEFKKMLKFAIDLSSPVAIRYPRGQCPMEDKKIQDISLGKFEIIESGKDICIIALGNKNKEAERLVNKFSNKGLTTTHINLRFVKPLDIEALCKIIERHKVCITLEAGCYQGGVGQMIKAECKANIEFLNYGYKDEFIPHGDVDNLLKELFYTVDDIEKEVLNKIDGEYNA
jgi:1-deoxy-D-xylulose-5-phosphate synthase